MKKIMTFILMLGFTLLMISCVTSLMTATNDGDVKRVNELLDSGADVNEGDAIVKSTPLMVAYGNNNIELANILIERGANVNAQNKGGLTVLHFAVKDNNPVFLRLFLEHGGDVNIVGKYFGQSLSPLQLAEQKGYTQLIQMMKSAESKGATSNIKAIPKSAQIGNINSLNAGKYEVVVSTKRALKIGELVYVIIDGNMVIMSASFPMMTTSKCQLEGKDTKYFDKLSKGMPVYKY